MKKLSLKTAQNALSRKELKMINGGYGEFGTSCNCGDGRVYTVYNPNMCWCLCSLRGC